MTKVKICGITNAEDAQLAARFGADALGFNFYEKSPRYITPEKAREIIEQLPSGVLKVGVFVNEALEKIVETAAAAKLDAIQLHGEETPEFAKELKAKTKLEIIKAFRISPEFKPEGVLEYEVDAVLLDAYSPNERGGTGETFDWEVAKKVREIFPKMYLAGGLSVKNVEGAIEAAEPYAVDACSRLEIVDGKKNNDEVYRFFSRVHNLGRRFSKKLFPYFVKEDEQEFSERLKKAFPQIFFIDGHEWYSPRPPVKNSIDLCSSKFVYIWNKEIVDELYPVKMSNGKYHGSTTVDVIRFIRCRFKDTNLMDGEILFCSNMSHPNFGRMKKFTVEVWKILNKMSERVYAIHPETRRLGYKNAHYFRAGNNTAKWCMQSNSNLLRYYFQYFIPKSVYNSENLKSYE